MSGPFMPTEGEEGTLREGFHRLANARENPSALAQTKAWLDGCLEAADLELAPHNPNELLVREACFAPNPIFPGHASFAPQPMLARDSNPRLLAFHAPLALLEGAWLQSLAQPGNGHRLPICELFAAYLALLGKDEAASPAFAYRGWLEGIGVSLPSPKAWAFAHDPRVGLPALTFASLQLALGLHSSGLFAEALGFTLAYLRSGSPWRLPALPAARRQAVLEAMAGHAESALQAFLEESGEWERVRRGYALYRQAEAEYLAGLSQSVASGNPLAGQVADIFRRKLRFAQGYHRKITLGGRGMEAWLAETPFDAAGFLAAFAASPFAQDGTGQRPFDHLNAFGGPMFGVFGQDEIGLIDAWLDAGANLTELDPQRPDLARLDSPGFRFEPVKKISHEKHESQESTKASFASFVPVVVQALRSCPFGRNLGKTRPIDGNRSLYHRLINQDPNPQTQTQAREWVDTVLSRARRKVREAGPLRQRFFRYSPAAFAERIAQIHTQEVAKHQPLQPPPKLRREEYAFGLFQFAPAILVDGCWLRHQGEAANQDSRLHRLLYRIYAEELGEGHGDWNHPAIYRDLLESLNMALPATDSEDFAHHPGFLDSAFDLPDYLLAISLCPNAYLPELLGLNLAIELSGLGAGYLRLIDELRHWNINPLIVKLHLSIDNLASGHSAMACEAVQIHLEETRLLGGDEAMEAAWRRVWTGYLSLDAASRRFKWALILGFCRRFMPNRLFPPMPTR